ncbi:hypothetical protein [Lutibacter sp.]|uniref:hypothetical protein n=1 Tax=Lutibacter sp. TaxID=1925666 RepID=UPI002736FE51|nr:hypothetical protein [Lutibacter sp.]MDP3311776.1 hypothetical protein [Lutibacter sp.]
MKNSTQLFAVAILFIFTISCKNTTEKKPEQEQPQQTEEQHHNEVEVLQLNNGKLWEANSETSEGINAMLELMANFSEVENPEAYATLKQNLETQFKTIIEKCSMTGEAHDQLHLFIVPMKDLFNGLTSSDIVNSKENFNKLNAHLKTYKNYFE